MAITGAHVLLFTSEPDALRAVWRDVFGFEHVDAGDGWLIFALQRRSSASIRRTARRATS
ncbi:MAG: hypothetical protein ABI717_04810 [Actinomycetota bacterium]